MKRYLKWLVVLALLVCGVIWWRGRTDQGAAALPTVETVLVEKGDVAVTISGTGVVMPLTTVDVKSEAPGRIIELLADLGDVVEEGDVLARIDPVDTETAYRQAAADLEAAVARVNQARTSLQIQRQLDPAQLQQAREQLATARARLRQAEKQAAAQPEMTRTSIAQMQAAYDSARAALKELREVTQPQARVDAATAVKQADSAVTQAQAAVRQAESSVTQSKASVRSAEENLRMQSEALRQLKAASHPQARVAAKAAVDQAEANVEKARRDLKRQRELQEKGFVARSAVDDAETTVTVAEAQLASAKEKLRTIETAQDAERKTAEARVADARARLDEARARVASAEAQLADAKARVTTATAQRTSARQRHDNLDAQQATELRTAEAKVEQAKAALESAKANVVQNDIRQEELVSAQAAVRQAEAVLAAAQANQLQSQVREADTVTAGAQVERARAQLANAQKQLRETTILAPRDGIILEKYVEEGTMVVSGSRGLASGTAGNIFQLGDMSRVFIDCEVDETDIGKVWVDQMVDITIDAFPDMIFDGKVTRINPQTTTEQNVTYVHVKIEIDMPDPRLKPGMTATCDFVVERREDVLVAPIEAVREEESGVVVDLLTDKEPADPESARAVPMESRGAIVTRWVVTTPIEVGLEGNETVEIKSGLKEDDVLVVSIVEPPQRGGPSLRRIMRSGTRGGRR